MEGADPNRRIAREPLDAAGHFVGRLVGEGQGQDLVARHSLLEQPSDAMGDDAGFAAARPRQYQQWPLEMGNRLACASVSSRSMTVGPACRAGLR